MENSSLLFWIFFHLILIMITKHFNWIDLKRTIREIKVDMGLKHRVAETFVWSLWRVMTTFVWSVWRVMTTFVWSLWRVMNHCSFIQNREKIFLRNLWQIIKFPQLEILMHCIKIILFCSFAKIMTALLNIYIYIYSLPQRFWNMERIYEMSSWKFFNEFGNK